MASEKPKEQRLAECMTVLRDIAGLGIPMSSPEVVKLRDRISAYVNDGTCWAGVIDFSAYGRMAEVSLPRRADVAVEVMLRVPHAGRQTR
jgi:hypothetical protein